MVKKILERTMKKNGNGQDGLIENPELVFGLVGPIGVDLDGVVEALSQALAEVKYSSHPIHLTDHIKDSRIRTEIDESSYFLRYKSLIKYGNDFRHLAKVSSAIAGIAIVKIREKREELSGSAVNPALGNAYILRQFKRPEEIDLLRRVYGRKFIQVSVYGSISDRRKMLIEKIKAYDSSPKSDAECEKQAIELIDTDHNQKENKDGQRLSDVFHLGDVFVDGVHKNEIHQTIRRFIQAIFGETSCSPTKDEYGLYIATAASFRSVDLSRQVGAAIFTPNGEVVSLGSNEVPKAKGGTYWCDDPDPIARDVELGSDPNQTRKNEILYDLIERMADEDLLCSEIMAIEDNQKRVDKFIENSRIKDSQVLDIIEFGRIIHAEMSAISDAARLGRITAGTTIYCTTFPCHICAKHIVAAGIYKVVFLEPYPKSYAHKLHSDSITFETKETDKVLFRAFIGISPRRYRDIFEKRKRKDKKGKAIAWYWGKPEPMIEDRSSSYIDNEEGGIVQALKRLLSR